MVAESVYQSLVDRLVKKPQVSLALTLFPIQEAVKNNRRILVGKAVHFSVVADEGILILADIQNLGRASRMLEQMYQIHEIKNSRTLVCKLHGPIFNPIHFYEEPTSLSFRSSASAVSAGVEPKTISFRKTALSLFGKARRNASRTESVVLLFIVFLFVAR